MAPQFRLMLVLCLLSLDLVVIPETTPAQVRGDEAELGRLQAKAEDAIANDDPDGGAMMMGRAALLSAQMGKRQEGWQALFFKGQEALFRSQEHTYRAMALFRRAGGQLPASSGVCGSLALAHTSLGHVAEVPAPVQTDQRGMESAQRLHDSADHWRTVIEAMIAEYQCR
ncbi:MAG: hypothetical protein U0412_07470 [Nitrospira sp.]